LFSTVALSTTVLAEIVARLSRMRANRGVI
jgi:hypothetical protein